MGKILMLNDVRCSFLTLGEPEQYQGKGPYRWSATALIPYASKLNKAIEDAYKELAAARFGDKKWVKVYEALLQDPKGCAWRDGKHKDYEGYEGHYALTAHRYKDKGRPLVFSKLKEPIFNVNNETNPGMGGIIYSGCFVNMQVELWASDGKESKNLGATLLGIQKMRDGDAFGGGAAPDPDSFGEIADGSDESAMAGGDDDDIAG